MINTRISASDIIRDHLRSYVRETWQYSYLRIRSRHVGNPASRLPSKLPISQARTQEITQIFFGGVCFTSFSISNSNNSFFNYTHIFKQCKSQQTKFGPKITIKSKEILFPIRQFFLRPKVFYGSRGC